MLTPATITVNFTANYAGPHRICWRQCSVGAYVCTNIVECVGGGNACSATISIMVDPESCTPACFEGYIQATCNPEGSSVDRVPWTVTFEPSPACKGYIITTDFLCIIPPQLGPVVAAVDMGLNCNGTARPDLQIYCGSSVRLCAITPIPNLPVTNYVMTESDFCCYDCTQYDVTISPIPPSGILDGSFFYYIDCNTRELIREDVSGSSPVSFLGLCAVTGSISLQLTVEATGLVTATGTCP